MKNRWFIQVGSMPTGALEASPIERSDSEMDEVVRPSLFHLFQMLDRRTVEAIQEYYAG